MRDFSGNQQCSVVTRLIDSEQSPNTYVLWLPDFSISTHHKNNIITHYYNIQYPILLEDSIIFCSGNHKDSHKY